MFHCRFGKRETAIYFGHDPMGCWWWFEAPELMAQICGWMFNIRTIHWDNCRERRKSIFNHFPGIEHCSWGIINSPESYCGWIFDILYAYYKALTMNGRSMFSEWYSFYERQSVTLASFFSCESSKQNPFKAALCHLKWIRSREIVIWYVQNVYDPVHPAHSSRSS